MKETDKIIDRVIYREMDNGLVVIPNLLDNKIRYLVYTSTDTYVPGFGWAYQFSHEQITERK